MTFLLAPPPDLPPRADLGAVLAVLDERPTALRRSSTFLGLGVVAAAIVIGLQETRFYPVAAAPILGVYALLSARRTYVGVGQGWVYARQHALGQGRWLALDQLARAYTNVAGGAHFLVLRDTSGHKLVFRVRSLNSTSFAFHLARQVLASPATQSESARVLLVRWSFITG